MEHELRELLRDRAEEMDLAPEIPPPLLRRARQRRLVTGSVAVALAAAVLAGGIVGVRGWLSASPPRPAEPTPSPTPSAEPSPTPSPSLSPEPSPTPPPSPSPAATRVGRPPATFVALVSDRSVEPVGRLVVVDSRTGEVRSTVVERVYLAEGFGGMTLSPDGRVLYFTQGTSACSTEVRSVPVSGGRVRVVVRDADAAALSPDGSRLAYVEGSGCLEPQRLVVRDLDTGRETRWKLGARAPEFESSLCGTAWLPDSRRLVVDDCSGELEVLRMVDVERDRGITLHQARSLGPPGVSLSLIGFHADTGGVAAMWDSCPAIVPQDCPEPDRVVSVDPQSGQVVATLFELPRPASPPVLDRSGRHFLWLQDRRVMWWDGTRLVELARGFSNATW